VRVTLSNTFGTAPLEIGAVSIALRDKDSAIVERSAKRLTFSGNASMTIPPGAVALSDPVDLQVPPLADLVVDIHLPGDVPGPTSPYTMHAGANQTNYISAAGNHAGKAALPVMTTTASWFLLARVEVPSWRLATRSPTGRARRSIPTTAGPISSRGGWPPSAPARAWPSSTPASRATAC
jgi:hypothetical protein